MAAFACLSYEATPIIVDIVEERLEFAKKN